MQINVIHIYGGSGSGTSTLGDAFSRESGYYFMAVSYTHLDVYKRQVPPNPWILPPYKTNSFPFYLHRHTSWISAAVQEEIRNISWLMDIIQMPSMDPKNYAESHLNTQESL